MIHWLHWLLAKGEIMNRHKFIYAEVVAPALPAWGVGAQVVVVCGCGCGIVCGPVRAAK
jgi:hypothetical protein